MATDSQKWCVRALRAELRDICRHSRTAIQRSHSELCSGASRRIDGVDATPSDTLVCPRVFPHPSAISRKSRAMKRYDVVIVGGGIHGAGVLQAAAAAGHSALLIERLSLASGTSSRSSKLIHGGLRYLESGQFALVRESLRERAIHLRIAAELVELKAFFIPVYRDTRRRPWQLKLGLWMYALLGGFDASTRFGTVAKREWSSLDGLETKGLEAVIRYYDAQTDDALLTRAVVQSALSLGAELAMPANFTRATLAEDAVAVVYDQNGSSVECTARVLVNAAGPWAPHVGGAIQP